MKPESAFDCDCGLKDLGRIGLSLLAIVLISGIAITKATVRWGWNWFQELTQKNEFLG